MKIKEQSFTMDWKRKGILKYKILPMKTKNHRGKKLEKVWTNRMMPPCPCNRSSKTTMSATLCKLTCRSNTALLKIPSDHVHEIKQAELKIRGPKKVWRRVTLKAQITVSCVSYQPLGQPLKNNQGRVSRPPEHFRQPGKHFSLPRG